MIPIYMESSGNSGRTISGNDLKIIQGTGKEDYIYIAKGLNQQQKYGY